MSESDRDAELAAQAAQHAANDYADYHYRRGNGTWRAWEHGGDFPGAGAFGLGSYYSDATAPKPEKEKDK